MTPEELLKYQKEEVDFQPDKASEWNYPPEDDHWMLSHNSLRGEMDQISKSINNIVVNSASSSGGGEEEVEVEEWKIRSLKKIWIYHKEHTLAHHKSEEDILIPFLETRCKYPEKASEGHNEIEKTLQELDEKMNTIKTKTDIIELQKSYENYHQNLMVPHLLEEETLVMPLMRAYFSQAEFKPTGKEMGLKGGHSGSIVYFADEDKFRNELMAKWGMPSFVWYVAFSRALKEYKIGVLQHVEALEKNEPPQDDDSNCVIQ